MLQSEMANSISRPDQEGVRQLCSEIWCFFVVGHIFVKCLDLFKYQWRNFSDLDSTNSPRLVDCSWQYIVKENQSFLKVDLLEAWFKRLGRQISLGRRVFYIIKAGLSQGSLSFLPGGR